MVLIFLTIGVVIVLSLLHHIIAFALTLWSWVVIVSFVIVVGRVGFLLHYVLDPLADWRKTRDNSGMAGHFLGLVGVLYAVVLAFVVVTAWQQRDHTEEVSMQEESAATDLFDTVGAFSGDLVESRHIQELLLNYATTTELEWKEMRDWEDLCEYANFLNERERECQPINGHLPASRLSNTLLLRIETHVVQLDPRNARDEIIYRQSLPLVFELIDSRSHRRHHYLEPPLPLSMWLGFLIGAFIVVCLIYLLEESSPAQRLRATALSAMVGLMWALALIFDHPFIGYGAIDGTQWCRIVEHFRLELNPALAEQPDHCPIDFHESSKN
jgi:hypothetical protein